MIRFLNQLSARRRPGPGDMPCTKLLWRTHVEQPGVAVVGLPPALPVAPYDKAYARAGCQLPGRNAFGFFACAFLRLSIATLFKLQPRQRPADCSVTQCGYGIGDPCIDQRLRADNAARAPGTVHDNLRLRAGHLRAGLQHKVTARQTYTAGDIHRLVFIKAAHVQNHQLGTLLFQPVHVLRAKRRRMALCFNKLPEGFARRVNIDKQFSARLLPALKPAGKQRHVAVAKLLQLIHGKARQPFTVVIDGNRR